MGGYVVNIALVCTEIGGKRISLHIWYLQTILSRFENPEIEVDNQPISFKQTHQQIVHAIYDPFH